MELSGAFSVIEKIENVTLSQGAAISHMPFSHVLSVLVLEHFCRSTELDIH